MGAVDDVEFIGVVEDVVEGNKEADQVAAEMNVVDCDKCLFAIEKYRGDSLVGFINKGLGDCEVNLQNHEGLQKRLYEIDKQMEKLLKEKVFVVDAVEFYDKQIAYNKLDEFTHAVAVRKVILTHQGTPDEAGWRDTPNWAAFDTAK